MLLQGFQAALFAQRHRFALWLPVWSGIGISLYFGIRFEPKLGLIFSVTTCFLFLSLLTRILPETLRVLCWIPVFVCVGFLLAVI